MFDRELSVFYARKWANSFNPHYYNFTDLGGDCTNFVSQCLFYGGIEMNYDRYGWYYSSLNSRAPAWTGVEEFWSFGIGNEGKGIRLMACAYQDLSLSDVIQLGDNNGFYHSLIVSKIEYNSLGKNVFVCAHDYAALDIALTDYSYRKIRYGKIMNT